MDNQFLKYNQEPLILESKDFPSHDIGETAKRKLILVCLLCSCFMIIEFIGGMWANSVAIMTDAAHLLSDLCGFVISIFALYLAKLPRDKIFTYGYYRAEVVGALLSVFLIWILTILLLSESMQRLFFSSHNQAINGGIMLATSTIGLVFNIIMVYILHTSEEGGCAHLHNHQDLGGLILHSDASSHNHKQKSHDHEHGTCSHSHNNIHDSTHSHETKTNIKPIAKFLEMKEIIPISHLNNLSSNKIRNGYNINREITEEDVNEDENYKNCNRSCGGHSNNADHNNNEDTEIQQHESKLNNNNNNYSSTLNKNHLIRQSGSCKYDKCSDKIQCIVNKAPVNKSRTINFKNFQREIGSRKNIIIEKSDFSPLRMSQRSSQNITSRRHSRLLQNLENYLSLAESSNCKLHALSPSNKSLNKFNLSNKENIHTHLPGHAHSNPQIQINNTNLTRQENNKSNKDNLNVRAAMIHIIGDIIQSIGVIVSAFIIYFFPRFQVIDPIMTIIFSVIVSFTTFPIIKQCVFVIMQATPTDIDVDEIKSLIKEINAVDSILCIHAYALSMEKNNISIKIVSGSNDNQLLIDIHNKLEEFEFNHIDVEIQKPNEKYSGNCIIEEF